jgi:hypothetical protein
MANCVIIMGASGTGKTTSLRTLDPKTTVVINVLGKKLSFKGSAKNYGSDQERQNLFQLHDHNQIMQCLKYIGENKADVKNVVIDDSMYIMRKEYFTRSKENGYGKYTDLALHFQQIIQTCEQLRDDLNVFFVMHCEEVVSDGSILSYQVATIGKLLLSQYNPVECVPMVLFSDVQYDDKGNGTYGFYTHRVMKGNVIIPAKTPMEMFTEDFIPNDLEAVVNVMNEYYNG